MKKLAAKAVRRGERGVACVEYAILVALLAVVSTAGIAEVGRNTEQVFYTVLYDAFGGGTETNGE